MAGNGNGLSVANAKFGPDVVQVVFSSIWAVLQKIAYPHLLLSVGGFYYGQEAEADELRSTGQAERREVLMSSLSKICSGIALKIFLL